MEIEYLRSMQENPQPQKGGSKMRGYSIQQIEAIEQEINNGNEFPKSFREYLFLGGSYDALGFNTIGPFDNHEEQFTDMKIYFDKKLEDADIKMERPFVIFDHLDGECFMFIYLDEGDDPQPWNLGVHPDYRDEDGSIIFEVTNMKTFSQLINDMVERTLEGHGGF